MTGQEDRAMKDMVDDVEFNGKEQQQVGDTERTNANEVCSRMVVDVAGAAAKKLKSSSDEAPRECVINDSGNSNDIEVDINTGIDSKPPQDQHGNVVGVVDDENTALTFATKRMQAVVRGHLARKRFETIETKQRFADLALFVSRGFCYKIGLLLFSFFPMHTFSRSLATVGNP